MRLRGKEVKFKVGSLLLSGLLIVFGLSLTTLYFMSQVKLAIIPVPEELRNDIYLFLGFLSFLFGVINLSINLKRR
jgi:hypothetical protein